jgi:hypothetical protein
LKKNAEITDQNCKKLVFQVMDLIRAATSDTEILGIPGQLDASLSQYSILIEKNKPQDKFPRLNFRISADDVNELKKREILTEDFRLNKKLANGQLSNGVSLSALEKLLYAILWKKGDLGKEKHLLDGVAEIKTVKGPGIVFNNFGSFLSGRVPYILDQHTVRCFAVYAAVDGDVTKARGIEILKIENPWHKELIQGYEEFYSSLEKRNIPDRETFFYEIDRLLFGLGKLIKTRK